MYAFSKNWITIKQAILRETSEYKLHKHKLVTKEIKIAKNAHLTWD